MKNILLCDDNKVELCALENMLKAYYMDGAFVTAFSQPDEVIRHLSKKRPVDIAFLDIIMPGMTGIELAQEMRQTGYGGYIVFLTSSNDFAAESYGVDAFSYLIKPVEKNMLAEVLEKIEKKMSDVDSAGITVLTKQTLRKIKFSELMYLEARSRMIHFHMSDGESICFNASLKEYAGRLFEDRRFLPCHNSFILNMDYVKSVEGREVTIRNGDIVPISRRYAQFKRQYLSWLLGGDDACG